MARSGFHTLKRRFTEFSEGNVSDSAAAWTYYGLLAMSRRSSRVAIVGLFGDPASTSRR
jgi:hypothetical protein